MIKPPAIATIWRNNKMGNLYRVLHHALHSETAEPLIVYCRVDNDKDVWCRPLEGEGAWYQKFTEVEGDRPLSAPFYPPAATKEDGGHSAL